LSWKLGKRIFWFVQQVYELIGLMWCVVESGSNKSWSKAAAAIQISRNLKLWDFVVALLRLLYDDCFMLFCLGRGGLWDDWWWLLINIMTWWLKWESSPVHPTIVINSQIWELSRNGLGDSRPPPRAFGTSDPARESQHSSSLRVDDAMRCRRTLICIMLLSDTLHVEQQAFETNIIALHHKLLPCQSSNNYQSTCSIVLLPMAWSQF
jgi:hypothetical protein